MSAAPSVTRSTCPYCGVGCGVLIESQGAQITGVRGDPDHPANRGQLCSKGQSLHLTSAAHVQRSERLLEPSLRAARHLPRTPVSWPQAIDVAAQRLGSIIQAHGPNALGIYISGQLLTEDYYLFNKLAKGLLGTNNLDSNSRLCMSSAVAGYKLTLGADAPPACYEDIDLASCLFIAGSNAAWAHPILFRRIERARERHPELKIIVVDPRATDTTSLADLHLQIQPGTDVMLFHGLLHIMASKQWVQQDYVQRHTSGFEELLRLVQDYTPERVSQICGVDIADLHTAADWFARSSATLSLYCQGLNQSTSGTAKNAALINLHLATAQIGRPGAGPLSLTGQPNAMGGREVGGMANLMSAHRDLANPAHRAEVARLWGVDSVPAQVGLTAVEMFQAAADGEIKALWIACTNPAQSMPDQKTIRRALERAEFVMVQEAFATAETCAHADLLLPATTWGEKNGTVTNSERCISRVNPAVPPPGSSRHDWHIVRDIGQALVTQLGRPELAPLLAYDSAEAVWNEHRETTRGRDLDITGLSYARLSQQPQQWPCPEHAEGSQPRLYVDGRFATADGRARFAALPWTPLDEERTSSHPFSLTTGRLRDQWHGMTRTATAGRLFAHYPEPRVEMNPEDMARLGMRSGDLVRVQSKRGEITLPARPSDQLQPLQAFIAMHWGSQYLLGKTAQGATTYGVNSLTTSSHCPTSKQPELKHAAVQIQPSPLQTAAGQISACGWLSADAFLEKKARLQALLSQLDMAYLLPFADPQAPLTECGPRSGWVLQGRSMKPLNEAWIDEVLTLLEVDRSQALQYHDPQHAQMRTLQLSKPDAQGQRRLEGFCLVGNLASTEWLTELLKQGLGMDWPARIWLQASQQVPEGTAPLPRQVCNCLNVREDAILNCLSTLEDNADPMAELKTRLRCATQCGSCQPELQRIIQRVHTPQGSTNTAAAN